MAGSGVNFETGIVPRRPCLAPATLPPGIEYSIPHGVTIQFTFSKNVMKLLITLSTKGEI
jgi:hypothetical protein